MFTMNPKDVISQFFRSLPVALTEGGTDVCVALYLELLKTVSEAFDETVYLIDFKSQRFHFVSSKGIILNLLPFEDELLSNFDFYQIVHKKDCPLVEIMFQAVIDYFRCPNKPILDLAYFVFDFLITGYKGRIRMSNKIIPLVVNHQTQLAVGNLARSTEKTSGNLFAYQNRIEDIRYRYSTGEKKWIPEPLLHLNLLEWNILNVSKQGLTGEQMADIIGIKHQYLRNVQSLMFENMEVENTMQALLLIQSHRIVVKPEPSKRKRTKEKRSRKIMTPELLRRVHELKKEGKSNRQVAKLLDISEFMVRYWKKDKKLMRDLNCVIIEFVRLKDR